ncbi:hypothetical protein CRG94_23520 [Escherichia sp. E3356]|nr:hypothetical protein CRG94_23520 [Escherichia sp. E3356]
MLKVIAQVVTELNNKTDHHQQPVLERHTQFKGIVVEYQVNEFFYLVQYKISNRGNLSLTASDPQSSLGQVFML